MDIFSRWFADLIILIGHQARNFWDNLVFLNFSWIQISLDILLVAAVIYFIIKQLKGTRTVHILTGLSIVFFVFVISRSLNLLTFSWLLEKAFTILLVAIPVIFQQELRAALEKLGHTKPFLKQQARELDQIVGDIVEACYNLAKKREGALIVFQQSVPLKEFIETGIYLDARISKELILSIFNRQTPLHDGAVIVLEQKIAAASCILPNTIKSEESGFGTRHKAALGLSENTDALIVVISEERGTVSFVLNGNMEKNILPARLHSLLLHNLNPQKHKKKK
jgi:diadenylate cyclase